jgi:hypothetical protein
MNRRDDDVLHQFRAKQGANLQRRTECVILSHKLTVEEGGGEYVPGMMGDLVLFNSKQTGSTLALPEKLLTANAVARRIRTSDESFGK